MASHMSLRRHSQSENGDVRDSKKERKCGTCFKVCAESDKALLCPVCERYFHAACQKVDDDEYKVICANKAKANPSIKWFCNSSCNLFADKFMCSLIEMKKGIDTLRKDVDAVTDNVGKITGRVEDIENGLFTDLHEEQVRRLAREEIETDNNEKLTDSERAEAVIDDKFKDAVSAAVKEMKDRHYKKKSIVIFGIEMSKSKDLKVRIDHDRKKFENLCKKGLGLKKKISDVRLARLGKKEDDSRPMKVFFQSSETTSEILRATSNLKGKEEFKGISISSDKTPLERRERKKLMDLKALKQKQSDENGDGAKWVIKGDRVVKERETEVEEEEEEQD